MPRGSKHLDERWQSPDRDLAQLNRELSNVLGVASIPFLVVDNDRRIRRVGLKQPSCWVFLLSNSASLLTKSNSRLSPRSE